MSINKVGLTSYQLAIGIIPPEEAAMLLRLVSAENQALLLSKLINFSKGGFPGLSREELRGYSSLELFRNPFKRIGDILMDLAAYSTAAQIEKLIEDISKHIPGFEDEIRLYMVCFEDMIYLSDLEMQAVLRKEGLNPFLLIDTSQLLKDHFLKNVSVRIRRDVCARLEELTAATEIENMINSSQAKGHKVKFVKLILKLRKTKEIQGPFVPLTDAELKLLPGKIAELESKLALYDDNTFSWWMAEMTDWDDLAALYHHGSIEIAERMAVFLNKKMKDVLGKHAPPESYVLGRKEADAIARLRKEYIPPTSPANPKT